MKITFYANPKVYGGLMRHLEFLAAELAPKHGVNVIVPGMMMEKSSLANLSGVAISHSVIKGKSDWKGFFRLCGELRRNLPDVFHVHLSSPGESTLAFVASRLSGVPVIIATEHAPSYFPLRKIYSRSVKRFCLKFIARVIALNLKSKDSLVEEYGISPDKVSVIYNGVPIAERVSQEKRREMRRRTGISDDAIVVTTVSEITERKGIGMLLRVSEELMKEKTGIHFLLIGEGRQKSEFEERYKSFIDAGAIIFPGYQDDTASYLALSDIFVLPSFSEEFPFALLEAMAAGLPVVATGVGGIPEMVDHMKDGLLIKPEDQMELRAALSLLMEDADLRGRLSRNALEKIDRGFSTAAMIRQTEDLYRTLLLEKKGSA